MSANQNRPQRGTALPVTTPATAATSDDRPAAVRDSRSVAAAREHLSQGSGRRYWRSLEELAETPEFQRLVEREFPRYAPAEWEDGASRRTFLKLSAASVALAGLTACTRQPQERIVPYVEQPEYLVPGKPLFFATSSSLGGYATGLLAESHMGRPTKLDGHPDHPASLGACDLQSQAAILELYDPDRSRSLDRLGRILPWETFTEEIAPALRAQEAIGGERMRILTRTVTSPTVAAQLEAIRERFPAARWHQYEAANRDGVRLGAERAFGVPVETRYRLRRARVVLALDSDLLASGPGHLRYARDFAAGRRVRQGAATMNRLYVLESSPTPTGSIADHRLPVREAELYPFAVALAANLGVAGLGSSTGLSDPGLQRWLQAISEDLRNHAGESLVVAGEQASPALHALVHAINERLGNVGESVVYTDPVPVDPAEQTASLRQLVNDMSAGEVDLLLVLGANPVYEAPADIDFVAAVEQVALRIHHGLYRDETADYCQWHIPGTHFLESWGDARAFDGTVSLVQPLIEPLYEGKSELELLAHLVGDQRSDYDLVRAHWQREWGADGFDQRWRQAVHEGFVAGTALEPRTVEVDAGAMGTAATELEQLAAGDDDGLVLQLRPDPALVDGRFANNGWLQELPKPITLLTWDNAALIAPSTAGRLGIESGDIVRLSRSGAEDGDLEVPVLVLPGQAERTLTLHLGYGRRRSGRVGDGVGTDVAPLRTAVSPWSVGSVVLTATGRRRELATTQSHFAIDTVSEQASERHLIRHADLDTFEHEPDFAQHMGHRPDPKQTMFPDWDYQGYSWGMAIDLSSCIGCNACVLACQAENNVPVVGREQVLNGREMHWLRVDRYYEGDLDDPDIHHQPLTCMHCEKAPCEIVCPVEATVHGPEGLNEMIYNRCVGTRYCSNNCPYKVRRFNFFKYNDTTEPLARMRQNPDVTVRSRGVMEKCTYCVQRINTARIEAKREDRSIRDGEVRTACQEACPTQAIVFGDLNDPSSEVKRWKSTPLNYTLLDELSTQPRTSYLAKVSNPNPDLAPPDADDEGEGGGHHS